MSHFTYEIDERSLRMQLKSLELPCGDDIWRKFESFSETISKNDSPMGGLKNFTLRINRNVILPVVFGIVIILFSGLLFNFINIKNPKRENASKAAELSVTNPVQQPAASKDKPAQVKVTAPVQQENTTTAAAQNELSLQQNIVPQQQPSGQVAVQTAPVSDTSVEKPAEAAKTEVTVRKKRKKAAEEIIETEQLPDIQPFFTSETNEPEIRLNN